MDESVMGRKGTLLPQPLIYGSKRSGTPQIVTMLGKGTRPRIGAQT